MMDMLAFLRAGFAHPSLTGTYLAVWRRDKKTTVFFCLPDELSAAAEHIAHLAATTDVYIGTSPLRRRLDEKQRGTEADCAAVVAMIADIDYLGPTHKRKDLPPTRDDAVALIAAAALPTPTVMIDSGGGIHAWWMLAEPILTPTPDAQAQAKALRVAWESRIQDAATRRGWHVDTVSDLARVLRVPGTSNHKEAVA